MRLRSRLALIAGRPLVDCDHASSTCLQKWWELMQPQPSIGIPALYLLNKMESTFEEVPEEHWTSLAELWKQYRRAQGLK